MWEYYDKNNYNSSTLENIGQICNNNFFNDIKKYATDSKFKTFLEIGTWNGFGSTKAFSDGFKNRNDDYIFYSLECNRDKWFDAVQIYKDNDKINILNEVIWNEEPNNLYEIFPQCLTNDLYKHWNEVDIINMKKCNLFLNRSNLPNIFDIILLDGGEFTTYHEFQILKNRCKILMLNNINENKSKLIVAEIFSNPTWKIIKQCDFKNNYLIAEKINNNIINKTVIQIYKQEIKPENRDSDVTMSGLGDCIRGTMTLYKLSKIYNFNLIIDFRNHPIGNYIDTKQTEYTNIINNNINNIKFFYFLDGLKNYILKNDNIICVQTNAFYEEKDIYEINTIDCMNEDEQNFMKYIFKPNDILNNIIKSKINNFNGNYNIIHFRLGDTGLINKNSSMSNNDIIKYENIFNKYYEKNDILITDNYFFKNYIKNKYNANVLDTEIGHLGNTNDKSSIEGTLVDFFLQSKASKIKSYSVYCWISGFIQWNAKIYNIPIELMKE